MKRPELTAIALVAAAGLLVLGVRPCGSWPAGTPAAPVTTSTPARVVSAPMVTAAPAAQIAPTAPASNVAMAVAADNLPYVGNEMILRVADHATMANLEQALSAHGIIITRRVDPLRLVRVQLPDGMSYSNALAALRDLDAISERMPNIKTDLPAPVTNVPPVTSGDLPWAVERKGQALIGADRLGAQAPRGAGVTVALLDTGVDGSHPDLAGRVLGGYNFVDDNLDTRDSHGHGTACAGIIAGTGTANDGVQGIAPQAYLLPVKVMDDQGRGNSFAVVEGIVYAVERGAQVINLSIGTRTDAQIVREAIAYATKRGVLIVAASGNDGMEQVLMPSAYPEVVCVGAVDGELQHASFSNYGDEVDVVAPGVGVYTCGANGTRTYFSGTSSAAPFVAGALAVLRGRNPQADADELRAQLTSTADNLGNAGRDPWFGEGIVNLRRALRDRTDRVFDLAVTSLYFDPPDLRAGQAVSVVFVVQNQGTHPITDARWRDNIVGARSDMRLPHLAPGECFAITRPWIVPDTLPGGSVRFEGSAKTSQNEESMDNNGKAISLNQSVKP
ncbi:MAG: S8 family serine peptidase [bacterium]|nr:S8 family serine peptidase [bacterium]